ncbi:MAG: alanine--tRNA ligase [Coriobacteriales bacterium]|jgi:alanyl-tRNA synthetase|nr:alanine--tRNA ligase [Coriobacteriales bacterium]
MTSAELRKKYLDYFQAKGCKLFPSSSLIPDDPSLLLTAAGMVQFKPYFLQQKQLEGDYAGACSCQKCVRTTDIDIIGTTGRHLSFFEMLGNFSFGAYFKNEMCAWALDFSLNELGFPLEKLHFTVYEDDDETIGIWRGLGVPADHITKLGKEDNFWQAGDTGPCGPCSELYYDQGEEFGCGKPDCAPGCDCDRYLEYWNLVFTQFDLQEDGSMVPLPKKNIDTGMGLERTLAIINHYQSNYDTDLLRDLIAMGEELSGKTYDPHDKNGLSLRIVADHARSVSFMLADGILPSNEGRGYVLRRLLRRAIRHGVLLGIELPFFSKFTAKVIAQMGDVYPELAENAELIRRLVDAEEARFAETIHQGQNFLDRILGGLAAGAQVSGEDAFVLHDRYGFPVELTAEIAAEQGFTVDMAGFDELMDEQKERARAAAKEDAWGVFQNSFADLAKAHGKTIFTGYDEQVSEARIIGLFRDGQAVERLEAGQRGEIVLDRTPFYGEMGGQVGDSGRILLGSAAGTGGMVVFEVADTKIHDGIYVHQGAADGTFNVGDEVVAEIDRTRRARIERNHTATHLLQYALRTVLGDHVKQAGSLVAPERLRFDFTHFAKVTPEELARVEQIVNDLVMQDDDVSTEETTLAEARQEGVTALFGEKYGDLVRAVHAGPKSAELCGGTHVHHTAEIGFMKIVSESSVGANVRRIEAVTSFDAYAYVNQEHAAEEARAAELQAQIADLKRELKQAHQQAAGDAAEDYVAGAIDAGGYQLVVARSQTDDPAELRGLSDRIRQKLGEASACVLGIITAKGTPLLLAAGTKAAVAAGFNAGEVIKAVAPAIEGRGGGKPEFAQAGGKDPAALDAALDQARAALKS